MKITVIGTGYVGLVQSACMAELGNEVIGVDVDQEKITKLKAGISPIYEPGIEDLLKSNLRQGRLKFTTDLNEAVAGGYGQIIFIAVGTPSDEMGRADLKYVKAVAQNIGRTLNQNKISQKTIVINKSTVPIGTGDLVGDIIAQSHQGPVSVMSNPEFLREGSAIGDFMAPDRIVIGSADLNNDALELMDELYAPLNCPILHTDVKTAELIKYASNSMLATQISFINSVAKIAETVGADITQVAEGMRLDQRIGKRAFLNAGVGYGGSCFPKDVKALIAIAQDVGADFKILEAVEAVNHYQRQQIVSKIKTLISDLNHRTISIWGLAFKPKTDDMREAPAISVIEALQKEGAQIKAFDPVAAAEAQKTLKAVEYTNDPFEAVKDSDLLVITTEWDEFRQIDLDKVKSLMRQPNIVDGRNIYSLEEMKKLGFNYLSIGRSAILNQD